MLALVIWSISASSVVGGGVQAVAIETKVHAMMHVSKCYMKIESSALALSCRGQLYSLLQTTGVEVCGEQNNQKSRNDRKYPVYFCDKQGP